MQMDYNASKNDENQSGKPLRKPIWDKLNVPPPLPPPPSILKSWHKNPNPCQTYNTRHTCTLRDTQLYNSELDPTCSSVCTVVSTAQEGGGCVTGGGPGSPRNVHASSEYQFHDTLNCTQWSVRVPKYKSETTNVKTKKIRSTTTLTI
jgi:hypothetical protein